MLGDRFGDATQMVDGCRRLRAGGRRRGLPNPDDDRILLYDAVRTFRKIAHHLVPRLLDLRLGWTILYGRVRILGHSPRRDDDLQVVGQRGLRRAGGDCRRRGHVGSGREGRGRGGNMTPRKIQASQEQCPRHSEGQLKASCLHAPHPAAHIAAPGCTPSRGQCRHLARSSACARARRLANGDSRCWPRRWRSPRDAWPGAVPFHLDARRPA